jgi:hypothetical protein
MGQLGSAIGAVGAPFNECIATIRTTFQLHQDITGPLAHLISRNDSPEPLLPHPRWPF